MRHGITIPIPLRMQQAEESDTIGSLAHRILGVLSGMHNVVTVMALVDGVVAVVDSNNLWTDR